MEIFTTVTVSKLIEWLSGQDGDAPVRIEYGGEYHEITEVWRTKYADSTAVLSIATVPMSDYPALPGLTWDSAPGR